MNAFVNALKNAFMNAVSFFKKKPIFLAIVAGALVVVCVVLVLLLNSCSPEEAQPTQSTTISETDAPTDPPTEAPTEAVVKYVHPLTGEPMETEMMTARPFCVMLNNYRTSIPIHGNSQADIYYEALTEGGWTRCMGVFTDIASVEELGAIRSARKYFASVALSYDAIYVHYGQSKGTAGAKEFIEKAGINNMNGTASGWPYFFESQDRKNDGYNPGDECHFLVGQRAIDFAVDKGYPLEREEGLDYGLRFDDERIIVGETANTVTVYFNMSGNPGSGTKYTKFTYDKETKLYMSYQYDKDNIDGNTGETLGFRNIFVLKAPTKKLKGSERVDITLKGEGEGYYACNGQLVPIKWSRASEQDPFTYTLEDGTPLTLGVGKSYIAIVPTGATTEWQ